MGCNTSKENVQGAADEAKEDTDNGNIPKQAESIKGKVNNLKVESVSTVLHRTRKNGDAAGGKQVDAVKVQKPAADEKLKLEEGEINVTGGKQDPPNNDQNIGQKEGEANCEKNETTDLKEDQASTKTMSRCEQAVPLIKMVEEALADSSPDSENKVDSTQDAHGYDMTDPNLHSAATKIQTHFRRSQDRQKAKAIQNEKTQ